MKMIGKVYIQLSVWGLRQFSFGISLFERFYPIKPLILICHISGKASVSLDGDQTEDVSLFECISERYEKAAQQKTLNCCI
jgi:hypothetical protein